MKGMNLSKMSKNPANLRREQAEATRRRLIETGKRAFSENGYHETSVRVLSRELDISESLLYHHFPAGKKELFFEILKEELSVIYAKLDEFEKVGFGNLTLEEILDSAFALLRDTVSKHIDTIRIILMEREVREFVSKQDMSSFLCRFSCWFEKLINRSVKIGEIRNIDCMAAAFTLKSVFLNYIFINALGIEPEFMIDSEKCRKIISYHVGLWK